MLFRSALYADTQFDGIARITTTSTEAVVQIVCDGEEVIGRPAPGAPTPEDGIWTTPCEIHFPASPGQWQATVTDPQTQGTDSVKATVEIPGKLSTYQRALTVLGPDDVLDLDSAHALSLRVLPALDRPLADLARVTADYTHLCCEQTAAKILSAVLMYLTASNAKKRVDAERIIRLGVAREREMITDDRGFRMYPDND